MIEDAKAGISQHMGRNMLREPFALVSSTDETVTNDFKFVLQMTVLCAESVAQLVVLLQREWSIYSITKHG